MRRWPITMLATLAFALTLSACLEDEPKEYDKSELAQALAEAHCKWIFTCCDSPEREALIGSGLDETGCVNSKSQQYVDTFKDANQDDWRGTDAVECVEAIAASSEGCPRAFNVAAEIDKCAFVTATKQPGDLCQSSWDCSTKFCKSGVCANPLPKDADCTVGDRCGVGLKCVSNKCKGLQPDGSACTDSAECLSGSCGGGKCVASANFTCDGQ